MGVSRTLHGSILRLGYEALHDAVHAEGKARPNESEFWNTVGEYISSLRNP